MGIRLSAITPRSAAGRLVLLAACAGLLAGCKRETGAPITSGHEEVARSEGSCEVKGFQKPLRQSVILVDERAVNKATDRAQLRAGNAELFNLVLALGTPSQSLPTGVMAPRERLSIYLAPANGAAPRLIFTGCIPGFSEAERAQLANQTSAVGKSVDNFMTGGGAARLDKQAGEFSAALLRPLVAITQGEPEAPALGSFSQSSLVRSLQAVPQLVAPENGVPRLFILTNLRQFRPESPDPKAAREAGFVAGKDAALSFGRAEVHMVGPNAGDMAAKQFAEAFLLESGGALRSWGAVTFNGASPAPKVIRVFKGEVDYGGTKLPLVIRLAIDAQGQLVNSWVAVTNVRQIATPLTGQFSCGTDGTCHLTSDEGGLAQAWSASPGGEPEYNKDMPLGGLRSISATVADTRLKGRIFDAAVDTIGGRPDLAFSATETNDLW